jgi:hypothetical protein
LSTRSDLLVIRILRSSFVKLFNSLFLFLRMRSAFDSLASSIIGSSYSCFLNSSSG